MRIIMERFTVYPAAEGQVTITDSQTGRSITVPAPAGSRTEARAIRVKGFAPLASAMVYAVEAA
jgi:hypothetical protein